MTKSIFIEGIQGSGKSTLHTTVYKLYPELIFCREGDGSVIEG